MMCRKLCCILLVVLLAVPGIAYPESIIFPQGVTEIEESAFEECDTIKTVVLPAGVTDIGKAAFKGCDKLGNITIPGSVQTIRENVFDGCPSDMLITTDSGSAAARWAMNNNHDFNAGTKYRALLIGQTYADNPQLKTLTGPLNDLPAMKRCLESFSGTPFSVTTQYDLTAEGIKRVIGLTFDQAGENDVSLFYYSGHGRRSKISEKQGALVGIDDNDVTASQLRTVMDQIPGRKILILDSCYSGVYAKGRNTSRSAESAEEMTAGGSAYEFINSFISAFSAKKRGSGTYSSYFVMAAAAEDEESWESNEDDGLWMGLFTRRLTEGIGYGCGADINDNGVITIQEAYHYACNNLQSDQHAKVFPSGCDWFGWLRK